MKKLGLLLGAIMGVIVSANAFEVSITTSMYGDSTFVAGAAQVASTTTTNAPRKVRFINRSPLYVGLDEAAELAESIFSTAMADEGIELQDIVAEVKMGDGSTDWDDDELCRVKIDYIDNIGGRYFFYKYNLYYNVLYPKIVYNQSTFSPLTGPNLFIYLNPDIKYYYGEDPNEIENDEYDAVAILLRALAYGCGLQTSLHQENGVWTVGYQYGEDDDVNEDKWGEKYGTAMDLITYNENGATVYDVTQGTLSLNSFLKNKVIDAVGYTKNGGNHSIKMYNELEYDEEGSLSNISLNTIHYEAYTDEELNSGYYDLLDCYFPLGKSIREVTKYTMMLLRNIGWFQDIATGDPEDLTLDTTKIVASTHIFYPSTTYSLSASNLGTYLYNTTAELLASDTVIPFGVCTNESYKYYSSQIQSNIQWKRNPQTKNIRGRIYSEIRLIDTDLYRRKSFDFEIPFKPNPPLVEYKEAVTNSELSLQLKALANGSDTYHVSYTGQTDNVTHSFNVTANMLDTTLTGISGNQLYDMTITGSNNMGTSIAKNFTFGYLAQNLSMTLVVNGSSVYYRIKVNNVYDSNVEVEQVVITNTSGVVQMVSTAQQLETIDVSSLARGVYLFNVYLPNGKRLVKNLLKR